WSAYIVTCLPRSPSIVSIPPSPWEWSPRPGWRAGRRSASASRRLEPRRPLLGAPAQHRGPCPAQPEVHVPASAALPDAEHHHVVGPRGVVLPGPVAADDQVRRVPERLAPRDVGDLRHPAV